MSSLSNRLIISRRWVVAAVPLAWVACVGAWVGNGSARVARAEEGQASAKKYEAPPAEWTWGNEQQQPKLNALIGQPMPALSVSDWIGGPVSPDDLKGKILVLDIWATWCGPCLASIPHNNELYHKYHAKGVELIGVCSSARGQEKMADVAQARGIAYPIAKDPGDKTARAWHLMWYPTYAVVDRNGIVRAVGLKPNYVEPMVEKLMKEAEEGKK